MQTVFAFVGVSVALSGIYMLKGAPFVGAMQLIVYVGGLVVLLAFGIMLTREEEMQSPPLAPLPAILIVGGLLGSLFYAWQAVPLPSMGHFSEASTLSELGLLLMGRYGLLLEIAGLLLLVVLLGVVRLLTSVSNLQDRD